jgi:exopolysaccharide biosynthesis polyprenyl glycosylphosphotransferase
MRPRTLLHQRFFLLVLAVDVTACLAAYEGAFLLRRYVPIPYTADMLPLGRFFEIRHEFVLLLLSQVAFLYFFGFYDLGALERREEHRAALPIACALQTTFIASLYFFRGDPVFPRSVLLFYWLLDALLVGGSRALVFRHVFLGPPRRIVLTGAGTDVARLLEGLRARGRPSPYQIRGWIATEDKLSDATVDVPCLGRLADVLEGRLTVEADEILIVSEETWKDRLLDVVNRAERTPYLSVLPSRYEIAAGRLGGLRLRDIPLNEMTTRPEEDLRFLLKALLDRLLAFALLLLLSPLCAVVALLITLTSGRPVMYRQTRVGKGQRPFTLWKFRTMGVDAETTGGAQLATEGDARVTRVGRWLRAGRLDELPQLWNILAGSMSLVGPRPERPEFVARFLGEVPGYSERFRVKPGLTGLAQVHGEYHTAPAYKLKYDIAYIYHYSMWLDMKILVETVRVMLTRRGV